jgi:hypothetical protein
VMSVINTDVVRAGFLVSSSKRLAEYDGARPLGSF